MMVWLYSQFQEGSLGRVCPDSGKADSLWLAFHGQPGFGSGRAESLWRCHPPLSRFRHCRFQLCRFRSVPAKDRMLRATASPIQEWYSHPTPPSVHHLASLPIHRPRLRLFHGEYSFRWVGNTLLLSASMRFARTATEGCFELYLFRNCVFLRFWLVSCLAGRQRQFHLRWPNRYRSE